MGNVLKQKLVKHRKMEYKGEFTMVAKTHPVSIACKCREAGCVTKSCADGDKFESFISPGSFNATWTV